MSFETSTARALTATPAAGAAPLLGPLLKQGQRTVVLGETGAGKTTLSLGLLAAALTGGDALGWQGAGLGPALLIDSEQGPASLQRALTEAGLAGRDDLHVVSIPGGVALDSDEQARADLETLLAQLRPRVVLADPHYQLVSSDSRRATLRLVSLLDRLRVQYGFALLLPMHPRKATTGGGRRRRLALDDVAGTGAALWNAELVLGLERVGDGRALLRVLKDRDGGIGQDVEMPLSFQRGHGFTLSPEPPTAGASDPGSTAAVWIAAVVAVCVVGWILALLVGAP